MFAASRMQEIFSTSVNILFQKELKRISPHKNYILDNKLKKWEVEWYKLKKSSNFLQKFVKK